MKISNGQHEGRCEGGVIAQVVEVIMNMKRRTRVYRNEECDVEKKREQRAKSVV